MRDWRPITGIDLHSRTSARVGHDPGGEEEQDEDDNVREIDHDHVKPVV